MWIPKNQTARPRIRSDEQSSAFGRRALRFLTIMTTRDQPDYASQSGDAAMDGERRARPRVAIATSGRFHLLDLGRELDVLGYDVRFYSHVPRKRALTFGLPLRCQRSLLGLIFPLVVLARRGPKRFRLYADLLMRRTLDSIVAARLEPCEVFIGMSGLCVKSALAARHKFGATVVIERASTHIEAQRAILSEFSPKDVEPVLAQDVQRELCSYELADVISVPSKHVEQTFLDRGTAPAKLFRNPYGVDLSMFPPTKSPPARPAKVLMVGTWSLRKGCDVLWGACERANSWRLLHVGPIGDAPVPKSPLFEHHEPVSQEKLVSFFAAAHVCGLASREEGLSYVQAQALACGLPVVCTEKTGGRDLKDLLDGSRWVYVVPDEDLDAFGCAIQTALDESATPAGVRDRLGQLRPRLSFKAYAVRYSIEIQRRTRLRLGGDR